MGNSVCKIFNELTWKNGISSKIFGLFTRGWICRFKGLGLSFVLNVLGVTFIPRVMRLLSLELRLVARVPSRFNFYSPHRTF